MSQTSTEQARVPAIEIDHLTVSYGPIPALLDISVRIPEGKLVGIIGPNGSGKSTLIKTILGFLHPDIGEVRIFGQPAERLNQFIHRGTQPACMTNRNACARNLTHHGEILARITIVAHRTREGLTIISRTNNNSRENVIV